MSRPQNKGETALSKSKDQTNPTVKTEYVDPRKFREFLTALVATCGNAIASLVSVGIVPNREHGPQIYVAYIQGLGSTLAQKLHINLTAPNGFIGLASVAKNSNGVVVFEAPPGFSDFPFGVEMVGAIVEHLIDTLGTAGGTLMLNVPNGQVSDIQAYVATDGTTWRCAAVGEKSVRSFRFVPGTSRAIAIGPNGLIVADTNKLAGIYQGDGWIAMRDTPFKDEGIDFLSRVKPDGTVIATGAEGSKVVLNVSKTTTAKPWFNQTGEVDTADRSTVAIGTLDLDGTMRAQAGIALAFRNRPSTAIVVDYRPPTKAPQAATSA